MFILLAALAACGGFLTGVFTCAPAWIVTSGLAGLAACAAWLTSTVSGAEAVAMHLAFCGGLTSALGLALVRHARARRGARPETRAGSDPAQEHQIAALPNLFDSGGTRR